MCQTWTFRFGMHELHVVFSAVSHVEKQAEEMTLPKSTLNCQANLFSHQTLQTVTLFKLHGELKKKMNRLEKLLTNYGEQGEERRERWLVDTLTHHLRKK
jgi:hypothetical protein